MKILLHICCSNCALYPVKILRSEGIDFTGLWFNPNIHPYDEYTSRLTAVKRLSHHWHVEIRYKEEYTPADYFKMFNIEDQVCINDMSLNRLVDISMPPFPDRCKQCYQLRLAKTAEEARKQRYDAFSTTLLISPYQDFEQIVTTGEELAEKYNIMFLSRDFRPHFRDTMNLVRKMGLYRQKYCGCIFSREERYQNKSKR